MKIDQGWRMHAKKEHGEGKRRGDEGKRSLRKSEECKRGQSEV